MNMQFIKIPVLYKTEIKLVIHYIFLQLKNIHFEKKSKDKTEKYCFVPA